jgi:LysM repeat protein
MNLRRTNNAARSTAATIGRNRMRAVLVTGALVAVPVAGLVTATSASAADSSTWDAVANCESSGDWSANPGNGFYGGLQFTPSTWAAFGGTAYAASADQASEGQQIAVAEQVLASQGPGAWPVCSVEAGLTAGGTPAAVGTSSSDAATGTAPASTAPSATDSSSSATGSSSDVVTSAPAASAGSYTVRAGDTLSSIAAAHGTDWQSLHAANRSTVGADASSIFPGQTLTVG